jgi:hypothetical protein
MDWNKDEQCVDTPSAVGTYYLRKEKVDDVSRWPMEALTLARIRHSYQPLGACLALWKAEKEE